MGLEPTIRINSVFITMFIQALAYLLQTKRIKEKSYLSVERSEVQER